MKFLLFEWMVGGGMLDSDHALDFEDPFFEQGNAMFGAMAQDLIASGHHVIAPIDRRACQSHRMSNWNHASQRFEPTFVDSNLKQPLQELAATADRIILIAPESEGILTESYLWLEAFEDKWFGGPLDWIELASDKNLMQPYLQARGIEVPPKDIAKGDQWIAKPAMGAGSEHVQIFSEQTRLNEFQHHPDWRTEAFVAGKSVSVSIIRTRDKTCFLPPTGQIFSSATTMHYTGTEFPLSHEFSQRAERLAKQSVAVLPEFSGYIGIDMILADQGPDVVVEINPRMTMSYCNLPQEIRCRWLR
ncbi:ATP-grasp domain-containing protein [bacterium]|nr:ATP-grasp domain-containing protein [bacterium]